MWWWCFAGPESSYGVGLARGRDTPGKNHPYGPTQGLWIVCMALPSTEVDPV